jgi:hypothetical protein
MSARTLAAVLAVSATVTAIGGVQAQAATGFQSFTAGNGRVLCNLVGREAPPKQKQLVCWRPATGESVALIPVGGRPQSHLRDALRGVHQPAPPLKKGKRWIVTYAGKRLLLCAGRATGVACNNQRGHGFLLDSQGITTY